MINVHEIIAYPLFFIAGLELLLGFILLRHNPNNSPVNKSAAAIAFFSSVFAFNTGIIYARASLGLPYNFFVRFNWIGWFSIPPALQFLYYITDEQSRIARRIGAVLYPFWSLVLVLCLSTSLVVTDVYTPIPYVNQPGPLENPLRLVGVVLILWLLIKVLLLRSQASGIIKKELNYFFYGMLIFSFGGGLTSGLLQISGVSLEPGLGSYFGLPWVLLTFYAITRYNLFDIRLIISEILGALFLLVIFAAVQSGLYTLLVPVFGNFFSMVISLPLLGFVLFGTPLRRRMQDWIYRTLRRDHDPYQEILRSSTHAMATIRDLEVLLPTILESVKKGLNAENSCIYMIGPVAGQTVRQGPYSTSGTRSEPALADIAVHWLQRTKQTVRREMIDKLLPGKDAADLADFLGSSGAEVLVPIFYQGRLHGVLCLGPRTNGASYAEDDILLLETLAGHLAVAIENAILFKETVRTRESLLESEGKFQALAETIPAAIFIHRNEKLLYANPATAVLAGYPPEEIVNLEFLQILHPEYRALVVEQLDHLLRDRGLMPQHEFKIIKKNGEERWVIMSSGVIDYQGRPSIIGTLFDITERKSLEGKIFYMRRMEALGKLAGGVAHDFNNVLTSIVGHGNILQLKMPKNDPLHKHVDLILASTERAANLTQRLMTYGSRKEVTLRPCDLSSLISRQHKFLSDILPRTIQLSIQPGSGRLSVLADGVQLERIIMNLVVNARDAMPEGGSLIISTGETVIDSEFIRTRGYGRHGSYAYITVKDTGTGIDEETQKRIFEPFFTTKGAGKGTGFGLSIVYDIIKDHNGYIEVTSRPGAGSTFTVYLPLHPVA
jgi:PAS domain S-box-containing protein